LERFAIVSAKENVDFGAAVGADAVADFSFGFEFAGPLLVIEVPGFLAADCKLENMPDGLAVTGFDFVMVVAGGLLLSTIGAVFLVAAFCFTAERAELVLAALVASFFCDPPSPAVLAARFTPTTGSGCLPDGDATLPSFETAFFSADSSGFVVFDPDAALDMMRFA
jgi:hypothetical protein